MQIIKEKKKKKRKEEGDNYTVLMLISWVSWLPNPLPPLTVMLLDH